MRFGLCRCIDTDKYNADYAELHASAIYKMSENEFSDLKKRVLSGEIKPYSANGLVPASLRLTGAVDFDAVRAYAEKCFGRLSELGVKMLVFGSSAAKNVPDDFPMERAWVQLIEIGNIFADVADGFRQIIAVEGLRRAECNIVNTLDDVDYYIRKVGRSNFLMLADFYHMYENGESISDVKLYKNHLVHCHIAGFKDRGVPSAEEQGFIRECITTLKEMGYTGGVSFEGNCDTENTEELKGMFNAFKKYAK